MPISIIKPLGAFNWIMSLAEQSEQKLDLELSYRAFNKLTVIRQLALMVGWLIHAIGWRLCYGVMAQTTKPVLS